MKKSLLFLILVTGSIFLFSQNYQCINGNITCMFEDEEADYYAISIDSVQTNPGFVSYFNFPVVGKADWYSDCWSDDWPSWIGRKIDVFPNGDHHFYNFNDEPVLIKAEASTGTSWTCYQFDDGNYFESTVVEVVQLDFLGLTDSVKKISFQLKDPSGNNLAHSVNDKQLWISKNYGMVKAINFKLFPDLDDLVTYYGVKEFELVGISDPLTGIQNLTVEDIFSFDVGDKFHVHQFSHLMGFHYDLYEIKKVIAKEIVNNSLLISYDRCARSEIHELGGNDTVVLYQDTITNTIDLLSNTYKALDFAPRKFSFTGDSAWHEYFWYEQSMNENFGRTQKKQIDGFISSYPHDCIELIITKNKIYEYHTYIDGLGGPYWEYSDFGNSYFNGLVYYKLGDEEWGEPYDCDSLLTGINNMNVNPALVTIAPNPMTFESQINIHNPDHHPIRIIVYNTLGEKIVEKKTRGEKMNLARNDLGRGLFFIKVIDANTLLGSYKLIVK